MQNIYYGQHFVDDKDFSLIKKSLLSGKITQGDYVNKFETYLSKTYGSKYAVAVNNGTSALILAIKVLNLKTNSKIITTPITFLSSATSVIINNYNLELADIDTDTYTINTRLVEKKIKKDNKIKALIAVDYAGHPCDWEFISYLRKKYGIHSINDNCHSLGSKINNSTKYACKYSDLVTQSFHPVKHITTGEGGVVLTNNVRFFNTLSKLRNHGIERDKRTQKKKGMWYYKVNFLSQNYRISDINCALGISQIKKLNKFIRYRRKIANYYNKNFINLKNITTPKVKKNFYHSYHLYPLKIDFQKFKISKKKFFEEMKKRKIFLQVHYIPLYYHSIFKKYKFNKKKFIVSEKFYSEVVSLPLYYKLSFKKCDYVIKTIKGILKIKS